MKKCKVYLSGYTGENHYREYVNKMYKDHSKIEIVDPLRDGIRKELDVVIRDKEDIESCNIFVAYIRVGSTFGTTMEIKHAYDLGMPVYVILEKRDWEKDPWLAYHTTKFFYSISECFSYIIGGLG